MAWMNALLTYAHVAFGFAGLLAFWIPLLTRKGGIHHRRFGRVYVVCAYVVLASAALSVVLNLARYVQPELAIADAPNTFAFFVFLGYLALVTFVVIHHGEGVLTAKDKPAMLRTPARIALAWSAIAASVTLIGVVIWIDPGVKIVLLALSPIGILSGHGILRYLYRRDQSPRAWLYEHLGAMLGGGIAFHTAFAVFGANRLFELDLGGWAAAIPWIAPAALGVPATFLWTRHYQRKFGELA